MNLRTLCVTPQILTLGLEGSLDLAGVEDIEPAFLAAIAPHKGSVVVDLSKVSFLASFGMRTFIKAHKMLASSGGKLILFHPNPAIRKILLHAGMESIFSIAETEDVLSALTKGE